MFVEVSDDPVTPCLHPATAFVTQCKTCMLRRTPVLHGRLHGTFSLVTTVLHAVTSFYAWLTSMVTQLLLVSFTHRLQQLRPVLQVITALCNLKLRGVT